MARSRSTRSTNSIARTFKSNKTIIMFALGVITLLGIFYMLSLMNSPTTETFEAAEFDGNWDPATEYLVVFCKMEGCGYCTQFQPTWDKIYSEMNDKMVNGKKCRMVTVMAGHPLTSGVEGYPTTRLYMKKDEAEPKELGDRSEDSLRKFCQLK